MAARQRHSQSHSQNKSVVFDINRVPVHIHQQWEKLVISNVHLFSFDLSSHFCAFVLESGVIQLWDIHTIPTAACELSITSFIDPNTFHCSCLTWSTQSTSLIGCYAATSTVSTTTQTSPSRCSYLFQWDVSSTRLCKRHR